MKQRRLIHEVYEACFDHDDKKLAELRRLEFQKIFQRRAEGKQVSSPKWTVVRL
jgi:hypothetical protein